MKPAVFSSGMVENEIFFTGLCIRYIYENLPVINSVPYTVQYKVT